LLLCSTLKQECQAFFNIFFQQIFDKAEDVLVFSQISQGFLKSITIQARFWIADCGFWIEKIK